MTNSLLEKRVTAVCLIVTALLYENIGTSGIAYICAPNLLKDK